MAETRTTSEGGPDVIGNLRRERDELQQRLSDLATAVHDWAQAHGYFHPAADYVMPEGADRKLLDAWYKQVGQGPQAPT